MFELRMLQRRINRGNWEGKLKLFEGVNRDKLSLVRRIHVRELNGSMGDLIV